MESKALITAMKISISDVLETMFFLPLDFSDATNAQELWGDEKDQMIAAKLNFDGPFSGHAVSYIPKKLAASVTADFIGKDEKSISHEHINGTVKEIINIVVGNILSNLDPKKVFNLSVPELIGFDENRIDPAESKQEIFIGIDTLENHMAFQMVIDT
jgi:chemotaxis protein CheY-P-specific phosphatase CheC